MSNPAYIALMQNAAWLLALVVVFDLATSRQRLAGRPLRQIAVGLILGGICMALIHNSFRQESGIVFDTRSVLLSISGLFFGTLPTLVGMAIAAAFRLAKGGIGAWTGVSVTLATGGLGIAWRRLRRGRLQDITARELYLFGIVVHVVMLALMLTLPREAALRVLRGIGLPVILVYPLVAAALGSLLANRLRRDDAAAALSRSEERFRSLVQLAPVPMGFIDAKGRLALVNDRFVQLFGYTPDDMPTLADWWRRAYPDEAYRRQVMETWGAAMAKAAREKSVVEPMEFRVICKNGETRDVEISGANIDGGMLACFADLTERRRAEEALRESQTTYRSLFMNMLNGVAHARVIYRGDVPADLEYLSVNPAFAEVTGIAEPVAGRRISAVIPGYCEHNPESLRTFGQVAATGQPARWEHYLRELDRWFSFMIYSPAPGEVVIVTENVTDRKRAEERIQSAKAFLDRVIDMSPFAMWISDRQGTVVRVNRSLCDIIRLPEDKIVGQYNALADANLEAEGVMPRVRAVFEQHVPARFCIPWRAAAAGDVDFTGARDLHIDVSMFPILDAQGELANVVCQWVDVTEQKQAEVALRESEERFRALVDGAPDGIFVQANGRFLFLNPAMAHLLGAERPEDLLGADIMARIAPEYHAAVRERIRMQQESGIPALPMEQEYLRLDGARVPVETAAVPFRYQGADAHLVFIRDVTARHKDAEQRERLQTQLQQAQKMDSVGRLAGGVAHDFNNMLSVILGHAELAMDQVDPSRPVFADLREIHRAAERSADLTRQLLAFARKQTAMPKDLDLNATVEGMLKMLRRLVGENLDLVWHPARNPVPVKMDPSQIDQILANLCVNARDAIGETGKVTIETGTADFDDAYCAAHPGYVPGAYAALAVSDDGCGMDSETLARLFEPFFTTKEVGKGTGLGLATVYGIVKQNGGFIHVYSEPGQGSTFKIHLPLHSASGAGPPKAESSAPVPRGHETILLVEDDPSLLAMTRMMLEQTGYHVLAAATPGEAFHQAETFPGEIDLLMTDVVMPEMNGRELAKQLLARQPRLKRLFMSGYTADVIAHHGVLAPGVNFIPKPFSAKDLAAKVREALGNPGGTNPA